MSRRSHDGCWCRTQRFEDQPSSTRVAAKVARTAPSTDGVREWGDLALDPRYMAEIEWQSLVDDGLVLDDPEHDIDSYSDSYDDEYDEYGECYCRMCSAGLWSTALWCANRWRRDRAADTDRVILDSAASALGLVPAYGRSIYAAYDAEQQAALIERRNFIFTTIQ